MCARMCADVCCHLPPLPCVFQMAIMFMKIDTNCDGTVDWDEFCTYMLLEYQEKDSMTRGGRMPYPHPLRTVTRQVLCRLGVRRGCGTGVRGMVHGVWHRRRGMVHGVWHRRRGMTGEAVQVLLQVVCVQPAQGGAECRASHAHCAPDGCRPQRGSGQ